MTKWAALLLSVWLPVGMPKTQAAQLPKAFRAARHDFTIFLPEGWVEIPKARIDAHFASLLRQSPGASRAWGEYDYGYQPGAPSTWFQYPYILIQVKNTGKLRGPPEEVFEAMKSKLVGEMDKKLDEVTGSLSFMDSASLDDGLIDFDLGNHVMWIGARAEIANVGPVASAMAICLTEQGVMRVGLATRESEFADHLPVFRRVVSGIKYGPQLKYCPVEGKQRGRTAAEIAKRAWERMVDNAGALLILMLVFGGIAWLASGASGRAHRVVRRLDRALAAKNLTGAREALAELKRVTT